MSTTATTKPSLTLKRRLDAPPAKVYAAWTDPKKIGQWMGPEGVKTLSAESDARVGGRYRFVMRSPEGVSLVTVSLKPDGDGTLLTLTHEQFFDEAARDRHQHGWTGSLEKLAR